MKYILQVKTQGSPEWTDMELSEDEMKIEDSFKEKAKFIPLNNLRVVKEVAIQTNFHVKIID